MSSVEKYRRQQVTSWPRALVLAAPLAATMTALGLGASGATVAVLLLVSLVVVVLGLGPRLRSGMQVLEAREGDQPGHYAMMPLIGWLASAVVSAPVFDSIDWQLFASPLVEWVGTIGYAGLLTGLGAWSMRKAELRSLRVGMRRARKVLDSSDISEVTVPRLAAVDEHAGIIAAIVAVGAVDGVQVRAWKLAELTGRTVEQVTAAARELERLGLVSVSNMGLDSARKLWWITLTRTGVRVAAEHRR